MRLPDFISEQPTVRFHNELYQEHLEEASFLYEQRLGLFEDPEITWLDIGEFEDRLEAHIDALVVGEDLALEVCQTQACDGDFGELYTALCVFCRQKRRDLVSGVLKNLDVSDTERTRAVTDALKDEMPAEWEEPLLNGVIKNYENFIPVFIEVASYRGSQTALDLLPFADRIDNAHLATLVRAIGRTGDKDALARLYPYLDHDFEAVRSAAATALLRLGDERIVTHCLTEARERGALLLPLATAGSSSAATILYDQAKRGAATPECLLGLGLLGHVGTVRVLQSSLAQDELAETAAMALNLITGANLMEDVFIEDQFDEDELFEEELEKYRQGEPPKRADGEPFGENITRLSQNPGAWEAWLNENKSRFDPRLRYRLGEPMTLASAFKTLESEYSPFRVRLLAYEEMVIRYQASIPFNAQTSVVRQKQALAEMAPWVKANTERFHAGAWYFAGQLYS